MEQNARLPVEVEVEAGRFISELCSAGWIISATSFDAKSFGNWFVDLQRDGIEILLVKDHSQYFICGPTEELKLAGLWKPFQELEELRRLVVKWVTEPDFQ